MTTMLTEKLGKGFDPFRALRPGEATPKTATEAYSLHVGEVALVKSASVPQLGAHFIVVTGHPVQKEHGIRPQTFSIPAGPENAKLVEDSVRPLVVLQLNKKAKEEFYAFYGMELTKQGVELKTTECYV